MKPNLKKSGPPQRLMPGLTQAPSKTLTKDSRVSATRLVLHHAKIEEETLMGYLHQLQTMAPTLRITTSREEWTKAFGDRKKPLKVQMAKWRKAMVAAYGGFVVPMETGVHSPYTVGKYTGGIVKEALVAGRRVAIVLLPSMTVIRVVRTRILDKEDFISGSELVTETKGE